MSLVTLALAAAAWGLVFWLPTAAPLLVRIALIIAASGLTALMPVGALRDVDGESSGGGSLVGRGVGILFVAVHLLGWLAVWREFTRMAARAADPSNCLPGPRQPVGGVCDAAPAELARPFYFGSSVQPLIEWAPTAFAALAAVATLILTLTAFSWIWSRRR